MTEKSITLEELEKAIIDKRKQLGSTTSWVKYDKIEDELNALRDKRDRLLNNKRQQRH